MNRKDAISPLNLNPSLLLLLGEVNPLGKICDEAENRSSKAKVQDIFAKVYPTVSNGVFKIELVDDYFYNIEVLSILGFKVKQLSVQKGMVSLDMSNNINGLYVIRITDPQNIQASYASKIIIVE